MIPKIVKLVEGKNTVSFLSPISLIHNHFIDDKWYHCSGDSSCPICSILPIKSILNQELRSKIKTSKLVAYAKIDGEEGILSLSWRQFMDPLVQASICNDDIILTNDFIIKTTGDYYYDRFFAKLKSIERINASQPRKDLTPKIENMGKPLSEDLIERLILEVTKIVLTE